MFTFISSIDRAIRVRKDIGRKAPCVGNFNRNEIPGDPYFMESLIFRICMFELEHKENLKNGYIYPMCPAKKSPM